MIQAIGKIIIYGVFTVWCIFSGYTLAENLIQLKVPILVGIFCILVLCTFNGLIGYIITMTLENRRSLDT